MGCTWSRGEQDSDFKKHFSKARELEEQINYAILNSYSKESPIIITPIIKSHGNPTIYFKMENFQLSGSFKLRGAYNKIQKLYKQNVKDYQKNNISVVVASTGNFALACSFASSSIAERKENQNQVFAEIEQLDHFETPTPSEEIKKFYPVSLTIMVPETTSQFKLDALKKKGNSKIIISGKDCVESEQNAKTYANQQLIYYISPYNDLEVIAGAATIGKEIEEWVISKKISVDYLFVSVGGGGLIAGISFYLKYMKKFNTRIIGVQPENNAFMYYVLFKQQIIFEKRLKHGLEVQLKPSLSDATDGGVEDNSITFPLCKYFVDDWILVADQEIEKALWEIAQNEKIIVEGSAALAYAGCIKYLAQTSIQKEVVNSLVIICGQNIEMEKVQIIMQKQRNLVDEK